MGLERFANRAAAGHRLAQKLVRLKGEGCVVLGLTRGGVVVGLEVAKALDCPLDVVVVRKIGHPGSPEYAIGAVTAAGDVALMQPDADEVSPTWLTEATQREIAEAIRHEKRYMLGRRPTPLAGKSAIVVDDGLATGYTMEAALMAVRKRGPKRVVLAVPVATREGLARIEPLVDEVVAAICPADLVAIGQAYDDFSQVGDDEVIACLDARQRSRRESPESS